MPHLTDTQSQHDDRCIAIDRVGVRSLKFPLAITDREKHPQHTVATVSMAVDLPQHYKGTHMSRFVQVLHSHGQELTVANATAIPHELLSRLEAKRAHLELRFPYFRSKAAPVTATPGLLDYGVIFEINAEANQTDFVVTVEVPSPPSAPAQKPSVSAALTTNAASSPSLSASPPPSGSRNSSTSSNPPPQPNSTPSSNDQTKNSSPKPPTTTPSS
jgi:GTP cyclohydrolase IB